MSRFNTIEDVWAFLDQIPMFQKQGARAASFGLDKIREACQQLGNPQDAFPSIHVAGTNGKGTTCYLLEHIYKENGYKTGLFTSPHLIRYNERYRISGKEISDARVLEFFQKTTGRWEGLGLSYFEISTLLAFWLFRKERADLAIIETGLGGRLDSTNIIQPEIAVITSIGRDHEDILGNTLKAIAAEKAGIIKEGKPVIVGNISGELNSVFEEKARSVNSKIIHTSDGAPAFNGGEVTFEGQHYQTSFLEAVNKWNVACMLATVKELQSSFPVNRERLSGLLVSFHGAPGRFEKLDDDRNWYFCGAHNLQALESAMETASSLGEKPVIIFSMMKDKVNEESMELFKGFELLYYYQLEGERAAYKEEIRKHLSPFEINEINKKGILKELENSLVIFTGSFYFYATAKRWMEEIS